jgi:hypothetical protein
MSDKVLGWHWLPDNGCLQYPPHTKVEVGQTLTAEGTLKLCHNGMHASRRALDALQYAPGAIVCRVELSGEIVEGHDKLCARHRKVLAMANATKTLHEFACWCAEQALLREREAGREPDPRSWAAIEVKRRWLKCEANDAELDVASAAAWAAAASAARDATRAAWAAASAAAWAAAKDAAWDAARDAGRAAAWAAGRAAAWAAAKDAARDAVRDAQNTKLEERLNDLLEGGGQRG